MHLPYSIRTKPISLVLAVCLLYLLGELSLKSAPYTYLREDTNLVTQRSASSPPKGLYAYYQAPKKMDFVVKTADNAPSSLRSELVHIVGKQLNLPTRRIEAGFEEVRPRMSTQTRAFNTDIHARTVLEFDEAGLEADFASYGNLKIQAVATTKQQSLIFSNSHEAVTARLEIEPDRVWYTTSVPLEELSVGNLLRALNPSALFAGP